MKYRMIAIDLDGTLLSPTREVTPRIKAAIHRALEAGLLICFATGRNFTESRMVLDAIEHYDSAVFVGGAMVIDTRQRVTLHRTLMDPALARELCEFVESQGEAALALQDSQTAGVDYLISGQFTENPIDEKWFKMTGATARRVKDLPHYSHEHTVRIGMVAPTARTKTIHAQMQTKFGSRIMSHCFIGVDISVVEAFDPSVSKWHGILQVARRHEVTPAQIIAIGDDVNDLTMIANAGLGIAMGNSHAELLKCADRVIGSNSEDGLAIFLEELLASAAVEPPRRN
jgi:5-amino-6-(5-phospho-D-ribitylamino)uracil phosphatase